MINPKVYKEIVRQHLDIPTPEFQIVVSYDVGIISKLIGDFMDKYQLIDKEIK